MIIKFLNTVGLTNLSDAEIKKYYDIRRTSSNLRLPKLGVNQHEEIQMSNKDNWEKVGPSGGFLDAVLPGPSHSIVRNTETGEAKEVYSTGDIGKAIANGQFTDRDVSRFDKK